MRTNDTSLGGSGADFPETVLDVVRRASDVSPDIQRGGLEEIGRTYWKPVYHYFRVAWAKSNEDAKDLAQAFFLWLADPSILKRYDPGRGSFRAYLKSLLKHFVQHHDEALRRLKRGGGRLILNLNDAAVLSELTVGNGGPAQSDPAFESDWRKALIHRAVDDVRARLAAEGKTIRFSVFEEYYLSDGPDRPTYEALAQRFGLKIGEVHRFLADLRKDVRDQVRANLAEAASTPGEFQEDWNAFLGA